MSGRILIVDHAGAERVLDEGALGAVGFDCRHCDGFEAALARLPDPALDLIFLSIGAEAPAGIGPVLTFLARLRTGAEGARLPVIISLQLPGTEQRLALLEAGADEVMVPPVPTVLLQARLRNLLRARDTETELARREATHQALGFSEAAAGFAPRQRIAVISPHDGTGAIARCGLPGPLRHVDPKAFFAAADHEEDLFVIDGAAPGRAALPARELYRIVAELRSRS
ncbi:hypothetical protein NHG85_12925, partial [Limimaricola sp. ASW11-118]|nr:hypothetical protein [Limimaricola litoreus]